MKKIFSAAGIACVLSLTSCGGTKSTTATTAPTAMEFDTASGSWKPTTKIVVPPPHEEGAIIVEKKKPGMIDKIGSTVKKPLKWVGLAKDDEPAPETKDGSKPAEKKTDQ